MTFPKIITDSAQAAEACAALASSRFITVDTEFLREKTYYPKLCLIQLAGSEEGSPEVAIDPLAEGMDLSPVFALMQNPDILKIFHAARQDIEIFFQLNDEQIPEPLFDTQIAAQFCGLGEQVGYEALVTKLVGVRLDKAQRFTDWSLRPLSDAQIDYALADVTHLRDVYRTLTQQLLDEERLRWVEDEMRTLLDPTFYKVEPEEAWLRIKRRQPKLPFLKRLKVLCAWREREAIARNVPRGWVLHDDALTEISAINPANEKKMGEVRSIGRRRGKLDYGTLLEVLKTAADVPDEAVRQPKKRATEPLEDAVRDFLRLLLKTQCASYGLAASLVASAPELTEFMQGSTKVRFLSGWRYDVFGRFAEQALEGGGAIRLDGEGRLVYTSV